MAAGTADAEDEEARIRPGGFRAVAGVVSPEDADNAFGYGGALELGTLFRSWLHLSAGVSRWSADIDRSALSSNVDGSIHDLRFYTALGVEPFDVSGVQPYLNLGVALHNVGADIGADPSLEDALEGTNMGLETALGLGSTRGALWISVEARREFVDDVGNWSFWAGLGPRWDRPRTEVEKMEGETGG
jgi:hypothetical protein